MAELIGRRKIEYWSICWTLGSVKSRSNLFFQLVDLVSIAFEDTILKWTRRRVPLIEQYPSMPLLPKTLLSSNASQRPLIRRMGSPVHIGVQINMFWRRVRLGRSSTTGTALFPRSNRRTGRWWCILLSSIILVTTFSVCASLGQRKPLRYLCPPKSHPWVPKWISGGKRQGKNATWATPDSGAIAASGGDWFHEKVRRQFGSALHASWCPSSGLHWRCGRRKIDRRRCQQVDQHKPWLYFSDGRRLCSSCDDAVVWL